MCDTLVVVGEKGTWFAKNSDRDPNEAQRLEWHGAARHGAGESLECTWIAVPQVRETHAVLLSRPFWMWGAEIGLNEHGVAIGNEAVFTDQPLAATGLTGMDLVRLGLERAHSAEAAVEVILSLLSQHGQGGGCGHEDRSFSYHNSFLVADASQAFVVETAGKKVETERVTSGVRTISNGLTIPGFAQRHARRLHGWVASSRPRQVRTTELAHTAVDTADFASLLRDHGGEAPRYSLFNGAMSSPCMHAGGLVASSQTTSSMIAHLTSSDVTAWATGTSSPCTSLFKPVRVDTPIDVGSPTDVADDSLWWRHERLARQVLRHPERLMPLYSADRDALEADWFADPPDPREAFSIADQRIAAWTRQISASVGADRRPFPIRRYWRKRDVMSKV